MLEDQLLQVPIMKAVGTLAGGVANNFNNLLMGILGYVSIMLQDLEPEHPHYEKLKKVENCVEHGCNLTRKLLSLVPCCRYIIKCYDLNELIRTYVSIFSFISKEFIIHEDYEKEIWPANIDEEKIQCVFLYFYVYVYDAMRNGVELYIHTKNTIINDKDTKPEHLKPGRYVEVTVTNIRSPEDKRIQHRVFDPYINTNNINSSKGLALTSAHSMIKNNGGIINIYSGKDEGIMFIVYFPANDKPVVKKEDHTYCEF
jgi:nitrogen-specific signal transduction histidine kinase